MLYLHNKYIHAWHSMQKEHSTWRTSEHRSAMKLCAQRLQHGPRGAREERLPEVEAGFPHGGDI
jgi:hypothetical protein